MTRRLTVAALALTGLLTVAGTAGCDKSGENVNDLKLVPTTQAQQTVDQYFDRVTGLIGDPAKVNTRNATADPCEVDGQLSSTAYKMNGNYQLQLPAEAHLPTLARLREQFQRDGYRVVSERSFPASGGGELAVVNPADEVTVKLVSGTPPTVMAVWITTPCYRADQPL